jgi:ribulose-5-phosphate 4-epimerase/fuculose-1-phosphate aldolase
VVIDGGKNRMLNYGEFFLERVNTSAKNMLLKAAFAIHSEIHAARPEVACAAHSHSTNGRAFCATGRTLDMITQDSCVFYNDHVLYR